jgi:hypothetical protein
MSRFQPARLLLLIEQSISYLRNPDMNCIFYGLVEEASASAFSHFLLNAGETGLIFAYSDQLATAFNFKWAKMEMT